MSMPPIDHNLPPTKKVSSSDHSVLHFFGRIWKLFCSLPSHLLNTAEKIGQYCSDLWDNFEKLLDSLDEYGEQSNLPDKSFKASFSNGSESNTTQTKTAQITSSVLSTPVSGTTASSSIRSMLIDVSGDGSCYYYSVILKVILSQNKEVWNQMTNILANAQKNAKKNKSLTELSWTFSTEGPIHNEEGNVVGGSFEDWIKTKGGTDYSKYFKNNSTNKALFLPAERLLREAIAQYMETTLADDTSPLKAELEAQIDGGIEEARRKNGGRSSSFDASLCLATIQGAQDLYEEATQKETADQFTKTLPTLASAKVRPALKKAQSAIESFSKEKSIPSSPLFTQNTKDDLAALSALQEEMAFVKKEQERNNFIKGTRDSNKDRPFGDAVHTYVVSKLFADVATLRVWHDENDSLIPSDYDLSSKIPVLDLYHRGDHYQAFDTDKVGVPQHLEKILSTGPIKSEASKEGLLSVEESQIKDLYNSKIRHWDQLPKVEKTLAAKKELVLESVKNRLQYLQDFLDKLPETAKKEEGVIALIQQVEVIKKAVDLLKKEFSFIRACNILQEIRSGFQVVLPILIKNDPTQFDKKKLESCLINVNDESIGQFFIELLESESIRLQETPYRVALSKDAIRFSGWYPVASSGTRIPITSGSSASRLIQKKKTSPPLPPGVFHTFNDGTCLIYSVLMMLIYDQDAYEKFSKKDTFKAAFEETITKLGGREAVKTFIEDGSLGQQSATIDTFKEYANTFREVIAQQLEQELQARKGKAQLDTDDRLVVDMQEAFKHSQVHNEKIKKLIQNKNVCNQLLNDFRAFHKKLTNPKKETQDIPFNFIKERDAFIKKISSSLSKLGTNLKKETFIHLEKILDEKLMLTALMYEINNTIPDDLRAPVEKQLEDEYQNIATQLCKSKKIEFVSLEQTYIELLRGKQYYLDHIAIEALANALGVQIVVYQDNPKQTAQGRFTTSIEPIATYPIQEDLDKPHVAVFFDPGHRHYSAYSPAKKSPTIPTPPTTTKTEAPPFPLDKSGFILYPLPSTSPPPLPKKAP